MGLFEFLKNAGTKVLTNKNAKTVSNDEVAALESEIAAKKVEVLRKQKVILLRGVIESLGLKVKDVDVDFNDMTVTVYGKVKTQAEKEKVIIALGNVSGVAFVDDRLSVTKPAPQAEMYTVKKGDTLGKISKQFYGVAKRYKEIFEANKPLLTSPNKIYPGQVLRIPLDKKK